MHGYRYRPAAERAEARRAAAMDLLTALALGMTRSQAIRKVILPQTFKVILPPLGNEFIALLKDSFDRPRPSAGSPVELPSSAAFPSGHATHGVASLGAAAVLVAERLDFEADDRALFLAEKADGH